MSATNLSDPIFHDEEAAQAHIEASRWPQGPYCPFCGSFNVHRLGGKTQAGYLICRDCKPRKKFTCRTGTVMERSHVPLHKWLLATHLMAASKKGMSAHQFARMLDVQFKTAWFLAHRIRESMRDVDTVPIGGAGGSGTVEADETYHGKVAVRRPRNKYLAPPTKGGNVGPAGKRAILALVERGGKARLFHMAVPDKVTVTKIVRENIAKEARLYTDESLLYRGSVEHFAAHETVKHSAGEYVRNDIHTNTVEGAFGIFKRGMKGIYQHCAEKHLHRYLAEFEFRYNQRIALGVDDTTRAAVALKGMEGKRLTYRRIDPSLV
jgi:transposase-like protein